MSLLSAQSAFVSGLWKLARGWAEGAVEGPGALVDGPTWAQAVRRLADDLLGQAGLPATDALAERERETAALLAAGPAAQPAPRWDGQLLVVLGCGRSGTTWLERMLLASPETGGVDGAESFLFEQAAPLWQHLPEMAPLVDRAQLVEALRGFYGTVFAAALARHQPQARLFVEKTPLHALRVPEIAAVFPDACFVHVVRDGRDVARSISQVDFFRLPDPADAARLWKRVLVAVRTSAPGLSRFREVRYEDLLTDPVAQVEDLLRWAEVSVGPEVLAELEERAGRRVSTHAGTRQAVGQGTWQALPARDLARVYAECGRLLRAEGYVSRRQLVRARCRPAYWARRLAS